MRHFAGKILLSCSIVLLVSLTGGCSAKAQKERLEKRADDYFNRGQLAQAEVEYLNVLRLDRTNSHAIRQLALLFDECGRPVRALPFLTKAVEQNPDDAVVRVRLGAFYLSGGGVKQALTNALIAIRQSPTNDEAPLLLAEASRTPEDILQARETLANIIRAHGDTPPLQVGLGALLIREGKLKEAEAVMRHALELDPKSSLTHYALGMLAITQGDTNAAASELKAAAELSPPRSPRRMQYADFLTKTGNTPQAKQILTEMTKTTPDYLPAWVALAGIALTEKNYAECGTLISQALARDPDFYEAILLSGRMRLASGETDKAVSEFERLVSAFPRSPIAHFYLANALLAKKDPAKAVTHLNQAITLYPEFDDAILELAQLDMRRGNVQSAAAALTELVKRRPNLPSAQFLLANANVARGEFDQALATYRRLAQMFPTNVEVPLLSGIVLLQQGKRAEARKSFENAREIAPDSLQPLEMLVNLDLAETNYPAALERIQQQISKAPGSAGLQVLLGKVYMAQKDMTQAEQALIKATELDPDFLPAYELLAKIYIAAGKHPQALEKLQRILKTNPNDGTALLQVALIQNESKNYIAARDAYEKLLAQNPRASVALNNLAYLYSEHLGEPEKAYDAARKARDLLPDDPSTADTLGWILYKRGEYSRALGLLEESSEKLPAEPEVLFHLGMTHYMLGNEEPARTALQRSVQSTKDFSGKEEATRALSVLAIAPGASDATTVSTLERMLKDHPDDPMVLSRLAASYERNNETEKAVNLYQRAVEQNPKNVAVTIRLAQIYSDRLHDSARAMELAKAARTLAPDDPEVACTLGRLAYQSGDFAWGLGLLQEAQRRLGNQPELLYDLALAYSSVGQVTDAEAAMRTALEANGGFGRADAARHFLRMASLYLNPEQVRQSADEVQESLRTNRDDLMTLAVSGLVQENSGDTAAAKATYEGILRRYPLFTPAVKRLAVLYAQPTGDPEKAYAFATKARAAFPEDPEVAKTLGVLSYGRKDYPRAAQLLREAASKRPQDAEAFFYLGMAQHQLKQKADAEKALRQSLALNLDPKLAQEANKVLGR